MNGEASSTDSVFVVDTAKTSNRICELSKLLVLKCRCEAEDKLAIFNDVAVNALVVSKQVTFNKSSVTTVGKKQHKPR